MSIKSGVSWRYWALPFGINIESGVSWRYWALPFGINIVSNTVVELSFLCFFISIWKESK